MKKKLIEIYIRLLYIIRFLYKTNYKEILFIPHSNCKKDNYNVVNYRADNVLCLFNYLLTQKQFNGYTFYVYNYHKELVKQFEAYCLAINPNISVRFIHNYNDLYKKLIHIGTLFTANIHFNIPFKKSNQRAVCLGYYTPFKDDFYPGFKDKDFTFYKDYSKKVNKCFDFYITASDQASKVIALETGLYYPKFLSLGNPRNDIFYNKNISKDAFIQRLIESKKSIIVFTPTFRDYEKNIDNHCSRSLFGYSDESVSELDDLLKRNNAILVAKIHSWQNQNVLKIDYSNNIIIMNEDSGNSDLYSLLSISDLMITDYTSTYFDFLYRNRPVIFNFYDKQKYQETRGFSYNPIDSVCAGDIVDNWSDLLNRIEYNLHNVNHKAEYRQIIHSHFNANHDGNSCQRICKFLFNKESL